MAVCWTAGKWGFAHLAANAAFAQVRLRVLAQAGGDIGRVPHSVGADMSKAPVPQNARVQWLHIDAVLRWEKLGVDVVHLRVMTLFGHDCGGA